MAREIKYSEAVREGFAQSMEKNKDVFIMGEGVDDPKGIFGTTTNLHEEFGRNRVFDTPLSENGITGVGIGAALAGMRPVFVHARIDFALYSMDQLVNHAAKWCYMSGGKLKIPLTIRCIIGRGWGQGAQHSQNLQALFTHIPGLKVVMPTTPYDVKGLLISSIEDDNPVIFIEHRWLYNMRGDVPKDYYRVPIGKCKTIRSGDDLTVVATSFMTIEALRAAELLEKIGINIEVVDVRTLKPLDIDLILKSVKKTGRILVIDGGWKTGGFAGEIMAQVVENSFNELKTPPQRISSPDIPTPTSPGLTKYYYSRHTDIAKKIVEMLGRDDKVTPDLFKVKSDIPLDVPDLSFTGPF